MLGYSTAFAARPNTTGRNIALGKKYLFSQLPTYKACSGPEDATDLTDGRRVPGSYPWVKKGMVGWRGKTQVLINLGRIEAIDFRGEAADNGPVRFFYGGGGR